MAIGVLVELIPWLLVAAGYIFVVWAIWVFIATTRGILEQLRRIADGLEGLDPAAPGPSGSAGR